MNVFSYEQKYKQNENRNYDWYSFSILIVLSAILSSRKLFFFCISELVLVKNQNWPKNDTFREI